MDIRGVIFDCDGTLVDSEGLGLAVLCQQARALGAEFGDGEALALLRGRSMAECLQAITQRLGRALPADFDTTLRQAMADAFRAHLQPMPGAHATLERLTVPVCIATNGPRTKAELTLGLTGLLPHFEGHLLTAYEVGHFKPDPRLFEAAAAHLGLPSAQCAVVEDSAPGFRAGVAAGMPTFAVGDAAQAVPEDLRGTVIRLERLEDLVAWVGA